MRFKTSVGRVIGHAAVLPGSGTGVNVPADGGIVTDGRLGGAGALDKPRQIHWAPLQRLHWKGDDRGRQGNKRHSSR